MQTVSKAQFKAKALEFFREVEEKKQPLIITHSGKPVLKVSPYQEEDPIEALRGTVLYYEGPTEPVDEEWEADI